MLQTISKHIQGWIAGVVVALVAAAFVLWGLEYYLTSSNDKQSAVATVNGAKITAQQLNSTYQVFQRNYTQQGTVFNEQAQQQLRNVALQKLILDQLLLQTVDKMGFSISNTEVQQAILQIPAFQENSQFSPQRFQSLLSNEGIAPAAFLENIKNSLLLDQLSAGIQNTSFVLPNELAHAYGLLKQQRSFGYFILPGAGFIANAHPSDNQIEAYYQQHGDQFRTPEQVKVAYVLLSPDSIKPEIHVTPEDVRQFYQDNTHEFNGKAFADVKANIEQRLSQQQLNQVLATKSQQLEDLAYTNPASLDTVAKTLGLRIQTTEWISREGIQHDPVFADPKVLAAIFSDEVLKQNNNSQPLELKDGSFLVVRITERQASENQPLTAVRDQIKQQLQKEQGQKQAGLQAYDIQHALENGEAPDALAKHYHLSWIQKMNVARQDKTLPPQLLAAVFSLAPDADPAKKAVSSILLANGDYAIFQLESFHHGDSNQAPAEELAKLRAELAGRWGQLDYQLLVKGALDKAKVRLYPQRDR